MYQFKIKLQLLKLINIDYFKEIFFFEDRFRVCKIFITCNYANSTFLKFGYSVIVMAPCQYAIINVTLNQ